jgi:chaperonin GroES
MAAPAPSPTRPHVAGFSTAMRQVAAPIDPATIPTVTAGCFTANEQDPEVIAIASRIAVCVEVFLRIVCLRFATALQKFVSTLAEGLPSRAPVFIGAVMKIRPLHDRILVKRLDEESKTAGGLFIPDSAKEKPIQAKVIAVGAGKRDKEGKIIALEVKEGDKVLFSKYSGTEVKIDGEEHLILREDDLLAVLS